MASFVYIERKSPIVQNECPYILGMDWRFLLAQKSLVNGIVFAAVIKEPEEALPKNLLAKASWRKPQNLGKLEIIVAEASEIEVHEPVLSASEDSDAWYFGRNDKLGVLLQYMDPELRRTGDYVAHTSVHHHEDTIETYHLLYGACVIERRNVKTGWRETVHMGRGFFEVSLAVPPSWQHPVIARYNMPSIMLIASTPPKNIRDDHHQDGRFRDVFPDVIDSYTQRSSGLSAAAKEAGNL